MLACIQWSKNRRGLRWPGLDPTSCMTLQLGVVTWGKSRIIMMEVPLLVYKFWSCVLTTHYLNNLWNVDKLQAIYYERAPKMNKGLTLFQMDSGRFFCTSDFIGDAFCVVDILSTILRNDSDQKNELEPILLFFFKHLFSNQTNQNVIKQPFVWFLFLIILLLLPLISSESKKSACFWCFWHRANG